MWRCKAHSTLSSEERFDYDVVRLIQLSSEERFDYDVVNYILHMQVLLECCYIYMERLSFIFVIMYGLFE